MTRTNGFLLIAALALNLAVARAEDGAAAAADADPAQLWREVLDHGNADAIDQTYLLVEKLAHADNEPDVDACKANAGEIDAALDANPVGLALWYAAYRCADALKDEAAAARRLARFSALVRYGVESRPPDFEQTPIRVLGERDVAAFIAASGQTLLYAYYDAFSVTRYMPLKIALWDEERHRERLLAFDYLDARIALHRGSRYAEFPIFRTLVAKEFLKALSKNHPDSPAGVALEVRRAFEGDNVQDRLAALAVTARSEFAGAFAFGSACIVVKNDACAQQGVDVLLPWAEKQYAMALVLLAVAYDRGNGVERDRGNARKLIEAADRRLGDGLGTLMFTGVSILGMRQSEINPLTRDTVKKLAAEHNPIAETVLASFEAAQLRKGETLGASPLSMLRDAASKGVPIAQTVLGAYLVERGDKDVGLRWLAAAANANNTQAQHDLGEAYDKGTIVAADRELARKWFAEAGRGGDPQAMLWMGKYYLAQPRTAETRFRAQGWLQSAGTANSVEGALLLANLYVEGGESVEGTAKEAAAIYADLAKRRDSAEARYRLAGLLIDSDVVAHDPTEARRLLSIDADRGDARARGRLGALLAAGRYGEDQKAQGRTMLEGAAKDGDAGAMVEWAMELYYAEPPQRGVALDWWRKASDKGDRTARNNLAWALCTSPEASLRDPARGMDLMKSIAADDSAPLGYVDTLAACLAASGDFAKAESLEAGLVERAKKEAQPPEAFIRRAAERAEMFRRHEPFVEPGKS